MSEVNAAIAEIVPFETGETVVLQPFNAELEIDSRLGRANTPYPKNDPQFRYFNVVMAGPVDHALRERGCRNVSIILPFDPESSDNPEPGDEIIGKVTVTRVEECQRNVPGSSLPLDPVTGKPAPGAELPRESYPVENDAGEEMTAMRLVVSTENQAPVYTRRCTRRMPYARDSQVKTITDDNAWAAACAALSS